MGKDIPVSGYHGSPDRIFVVFPCMLSQHTRRIRERYRGVTSRSWPGSRPWYLANIWSDPGQIRGTVTSWWKAWSQVFDQCFNIVSPVFHQCFTNVLPVFHKCFTSASTVFYQCFTSVLPVSLQCFNIISPQVFHQCFTSILLVFNQCFTSILPVFKQCFTNVS